MRTFRFDTFGSEEFWGGSVELHQAIQGKSWAAFVRPFPEKGARARSKG